MRLVALAPDPAPPRAVAPLERGAAIPSSTNGALDAASDTIIDQSHTVAGLGDGGYHAQYHFAHAVLLLDTLLCGPRFFQCEASAGDRAQLALVDQAREPPKS